MSKEQVVRMAGYVCYSPLFYCAIAVLLYKRGPETGDAKSIMNIGLVCAVAVLIGSRVLLVMLLPGEGSFAPGRIAGVCMLVSGLGEAISAAGAVVAWLGVPVINCLPLFFIGFLYTIEFRYFRLPDVLEKWEENQ